MDAARVPDGSIEGTECVDQDGVGLVIAIEHHYTYDWREHCNMGRGGGRRRRRREEEEEGWRSEKSKSDEVKSDDMMW